LAPDPQGPLAVEARNLSKSFAIPLERHDTLKERLVRPSSWLRGESRRLEALRDVSFDVHSGEFFGIVGRNGSGKSTLLKILASIYALDAGSLRVAGRLAPFIELGVGFNPELNARDNVILNGVMMGHSPAEARSRYDAVIDYAELWDYTELKLKNYSSGMHVRLAFSLMLQADADIFLVDEVLAVGDAAFQAKCADSLDAMQARGTTIVFVTHDMGAVTEHCDRAMMIEDGRVELIGDPRDVADRYTEILFRPEHEIAEEGTARVTSVAVEGPDGEPVEALPEDAPITLTATVRATEEVSHLSLFMELVNNPEGVRIAAWEAGSDGELAQLSAGEEVSVRVRLENRLQPGNYRFSYALLRREGEETHRVDSCTEPTRLSILGTDYGTGIVRLDRSIEFERGRRESPK
jgi:ABC-type polysaccharide/polyol phosphate transport system ATPase subunit